jgi:hypothetical protein
MNSKTLISEIMREIKIANDSESDCILHSKNWQSEEWLSAKFYTKYFEEKQNAKEENSSFEKNISSEDKIF